MTRKIWFPLVLSLLLFIGCSPVAREPQTTPRPGDPNATSLPGDSNISAPNPYAPGKGDESLQRAEVFIDSQNILVQNGFPPEYELQVTGSLPTPCHQLRVVVDTPTDDSKIDVQVYSVVDPNTVCTQVLEPFQAAIPLGSYVRGSYTVYENGQRIGEITP